MRSIYLNHAGTSWPKPEPVQRAVADAFHADPLEWASAFDAAHRAIADFFHVADVSRLLLTPGCTSSLSVAIADHPWTSGDRILTSSLEHHASHRPMLKLAEFGVRVTELPMSGDAPLDLEALERELRKGDVRLVALTAAANVTGALLPIREAIRLAREFGAMSMIDGAQLAGWWDLDVTSLGADLFAFAGHKGLHAPWGIGGLYVGPDVTLNTPAATCEIPAPGTKMACAPMPGYCDVGSVDRAALAGLAAAVRWLATAEQCDRLQHARARAARIECEVKQWPGVTVYGPSDPARRMPTVALTVDGITSTELARRLAERGIITSGGLQCAPLAHRTLGTAPDGVFRLSVGPANDDDDITQTLTTLRTVLDI